MPRDIIPFLAYTTKHLRNRQMKKDTRTKVYRGIWSGVLSGPMDSRLPPRDLPVTGTGNKMDTCTWKLRHRFGTDNEEYWFIVCDTRFSPYANRISRDWSHCPYCGRLLAFKADDKQGQRHLDFIGLS